MKNILCFVAILSLFTGCCFNANHRLSNIRGNVGTSQTVSELNDVKRSVTESTDKTKKGLEASLSNTKDIKNKLSEIDKKIETQSVTKEEINDLSATFDTHIRNLNSTYEQYKTETLQSIEKLQQSSIILRAENLNLVKELNELQKDYTKVVIDEHNLRDELKNQKQSTNRWRITVFTILVVVTGFVFLYLYIPSVFNFAFKYLFKSKGGTS